MISASPTSLSNHFLVALPSLANGIFTRSITYLCEHDSHGAMGIIINHPLDMQIDEILAQLNLGSPKKDAADTILAGGPVHTDRGFVLHSRDNKPNWDDSVPVSDNIAITTSMDILIAIANDKGPKHKLIALGYAGWDAGQLEQELLDDAWLCIPAKEHILFNTPTELRLDAALAELGIQYAQLSSDSGHA
ncbi:MAG: YqgE/AlgH family protein [Spongiibacteraceae bacterium]